MKNNDGKKLLFKYSIAGIIFVSATGTLAHFIYDWTGHNPVIGLVTAVNESTWEHMKLIYFPMILYYIFIWLKLRKRVPGSLSALLIAIPVGICLIPVLFYTYTGILGFMITAVNLIIFYVSVITAFIMFYQLSIRTKTEEVSIKLYFIIALFTCLFFIFTYDPPKLGIFIDPVQH